MLTLERLNIPQNAFDIAKCNSFCSLWASWLAKICYLEHKSQKSKNSLTDALPPHNHRLTKMGPILLKDGIPFRP
jgi:hypothetical protein